MDPLSLHSKLPATSYFTLHIGLHHGRLWDLLGCEYYWGIIPHLIQGFLLWLFKTSSIEVIRVFNIFLGSVNAVLVYKIAYRYYSHENALVSGLCFAVFPLSAIFDSIGMQDVVGLFFFFASLYLMRERYFWSGLSLELACHSRIEYTIVSLIILVGFVMRERLFTDNQPYLLGWITGWGLPSIHIWVQTGIPFYPLHYQLYSLFGGYTSSFRGLPFFVVMFKWLASRLYVWTSTEYGPIIIICGIAGTLFIPYISYRKWYRYESPLYWVSALVVFAPCSCPIYTRRSLTC